jgi:hypothetical protein
MDYDVNGISILDVISDKGVVREDEAPGVLEYFDEEGLTV